MRFGGRTYIKHWTDEELASDRILSIKEFRDQRLEEPLEEYLDEFDKARSAFEGLLDKTLALTEIRENAVAILTDKSMLASLRYLAAPPISEDDLRTITEIPSLSPAAFRSDPAKVKNIIDTIMQVIDRRRFPWLDENREPDASERNAAIVASAALSATQRVATNRRNNSKAVQEDKVKEVLTACGLTEVKRRHVAHMSDAPLPGHFCGEAKFASRQADMIVRLWNGVCLPVECKVSNSAVNSRKRLNNDAGAKASVWIQAFGANDTIPVAVLSGVYDLRILAEAQECGLSLIWSHRLADLTDYVAASLR